MDWRLVSAGPLIMWAFYVIFGSMASRIHGEKVTMVVEGIAMMAVAIGTIAFAGVGDFRQATPTSLTYAAIMGLMSALGVLVQLYAFRIASQDQQGAVAMIGGLYPMLAAVLFFAMFRLGISGGSSLTFRQWAGVACGALALWLVSK